MRMTCCPRGLLAVALLVALAGTPGCRGADVGLEHDVLRFAYALERHLDPEQQPCDDFYAYVCGRGANATVQQQQLAERQRQQKEEFDRFLAQDDGADEQLLDAELKLKHFYASCQTARSAEELKASHLYRTAGGWPAIDDGAAMLRRRRNLTWLAVAGAFHEAGVPYVFRHRVEIKSNRRLVRLQPDAAVRYTLRKFEQRTTDVLQEYAVDPGRARLVALETMSFERARRDVVRGDGDGDNGEGDKDEHGDGAAGAEADVEVSYAEFKGPLFGEGLALDWDAYFRKVLGKPLKDSDTVSVRRLPQLRQLFALLQRTTLTRLLNWLWIDYLMDKGAAECQALAETLLGPVVQHVVERSALDRVQMARMYASLGRTYDELLPATPWIDEMTQQNSRQFLGRVIHLTLNGDAKLDADYAPLTLTRRNFYRNLEKVQRFRMQKTSSSSTSASSASSSSASAAQAAGEFMKVFLATNGLLGEQNLSTPLNYVLVGERFAEHMIAGGSGSGSGGGAPGAWRSMDSEREFAAFQQCLRRQQLATTTANQTAAAFNANDLVLKLLAQAQALRAFEEWQRSADATQLRRLEGLLGAGRLALSLRKLYFVGSALTECQTHGGAQRELVNSYARNSPEFGRAFGCRRGHQLLPRHVCKVL